MNYDDFHRWHFPAAYGSEPMGEQGFLMNTLSQRDQRTKLGHMLPSVCALWNDNAVSLRQESEATELPFLAAWNTTGQRRRHSVNNYAWCAVYVRCLSVRMDVLLCDCSSELWLWAWHHAYHLQYCRVFHVMKNRLFTLIIVLVTPMTTIKMFEECYF